MTTQEYVDYVSQFDGTINKEDLIDLLRNVIKKKMRLSGKIKESFVFSGSRYTIEAPEKN